MEQITSSGWWKGVGFSLTLLLALSLFSFDLNDPTLTNLRTPKDGVLNLVGLGGALIGGSLLEAFGGSSLLLVPLLFNWFFQPLARSCYISYPVYSLATLLILSILLALAGQSGFPGLSGAGLIGIAGGLWVLKTIGPLAGWLMLTPVLAYALWKLYPLSLLSLLNWRALAAGKIGAAIKPGSTLSYQERKAFSPAHLAETTLEKPSTTLDSSSSMDFQTLSHRPLISPEPGEKKTAGEKRKPAPHSGDDFDHWIDPDKKP